MSAALINVLSSLEKKTIPCNVTSARGNDRAALANSTSDRSNGFIIPTVKFVITFVGLEASRAVDVDA